LHLGLLDVALLLIGDAQGYIGVRVAGRELEAAVQKLHDLVELAEVHVAKAQVVEEIWIIGVLAEKFLQ